MTAVGHARTLETELPQTRRAVKGTTTHLSYTNPEGMVIRGVRPILRWDGVRGVVVNSVRGVTSFMRQSPRATVPNLWGDHIDHEPSGARA
jgi:hypothetical protein